MNYSAFTMKIFYKITNKKWIIRKKFNFVVLMADIKWTVMTPCRLAQAEGQFRRACCPPAKGQIKPEHHIQPHNTRMYPRHQRHIGCIVREVTVGEVHLGP
jgi:hypothetical protein